MKVDAKELFVAIVSRLRQLSGATCSTVLLEPSLDLASLSEVIAQLYRGVRVVLLPSSKPLLCAWMRKEYRKDPGHLLPQLSNAELKALLERLDERMRPYGEVVISSSGTTGEPKQVLLSGKSLWASALQTSAHWTAPPAISALQLPLWHIAGLACLLRAWVRRNQVFLLPPQQLPLEQDEAPHYLSVVPAQLQRWWREEPAFRLAVLKDSLLEILVGGGPVPVSLLQRAISEGWPLRVSYGLTEGGSTVALSPKEDPSAPLEILPHWEWRVDEGRLSIRGEALANGILYQGSLLPIADEEGWFQTTDYIKTKGSGWVWCGRTDRVIISGGEKIRPEELEHWLHQRSLNAHVFGVPHSLWGARPVGFVEANLSLCRHLTVELQKTFGARFAPDQLLPMPPALLNRDKVPLVELQDLWAFLTGG
jgi:acyl-CoA synthetase (AMP-forming)/AMP-acid ligase II